MTALPSESESPTGADRSQVIEDYGNLPLAFEANQGQTDSQVDFITRGGGATVFLTATEAVFAIQNSEFGIQNSESVIDRRAGGMNPLTTRYDQGGDPPRSPGVALYMQIVGGAPDATPVSHDRLPGIVNYFIGNDPSNWHANIPTFGRVDYQDVYPGIDLVYYGNNQQLEYDFVVAPGADPNAIALNFAGADGAEINSRGDLVVHTAAGDVVQQKPFTYQDVGQTRQEVMSAYVVDGTHVRFEVGAYDATRPLVIDPVVLGYSTYLGGGREERAFGGIAVDSAGNAYVSGGTKSTDFPTTPGAFDTTFNGYPWDAFVTKLNADGSALVYSTYIGGSAYDVATGIAVDSADSAYVTGSTESFEFPTTAGAFDRTYNGGPGDAFAVKLGPGGGALAYGTYLGGSEPDSAGGIAVDHAGGAYLTGYTKSLNFPTTSGAFDKDWNGGYSDAFAVKLSGDGDALVYGTYLGGLEEDTGGAGSPWTLPAALIWLATRDPATSR